MPVKLTPEEYRKKHATRLKQAIEDMRQGVERVSEAPGAKAARAADKWHNRISDTATRDKWARRVSAVGLDEWKAKMIQKGLPRVSGGIDGAADKVEAFAAELFAHQNRLLQEIERMPDLTLEDSIARATAWIRGMAQFKRGG